MLVIFQKSHFISLDDDENILNQVMFVFPYSWSELNNGFKYLGFSLKPNSYAFKDWMWLYQKVESRVSSWANRFLSKGGRLVLIKGVLQSILVYQSSIAYIPKGILTKIRKKCFSFLWTASKQNNDISLSKWTSLALPKDLGGWESRT